MTTSRTTTGIASRASPGSASKTVGTKTVGVLPSETQAGYTEGMASPAPKPARTHTVSRTVHAKPGRPAAHHESETASRTTTDHGAIRKWAEKRGGHPTSVTGTEHGREAAGVLRLDFGVKDEKLHAVDWDAFFKKFDEAKLAFLYQDKTSDGKMSRFHKFIHRH